MDRNKNSKWRQNSKWPRSQILRADIINLVIQSLSIGILSVIGCFVVNIGTAAVSIVCQITERLLYFRISIETPKRLLDHHNFWSHTSLITSVVYSSASPGTASQFPLDALIISAVDYQHCIMMIEVPDFCRRRIKIRFAVEYETQFIP